MHDAATAGHEVVILTARKDLDEVTLFCRRRNLKPSAVVHCPRDPRTSKAQWLAEQRGEREAFLFDDEPWFGEPCEGLGVLWVNVGL